ncbi:NAD(P)-dependent alcohol dehydrogenase [Paracoccus subflavus]|uniref:alcohol dehydrogenase (NADP(+)) n=1 Tax=Paracoccus subflavus TaxID=2528244 RepID=A0A4Q9G7W1_9RHOB|nr:NAD(P)-dependent alcohol dehydrogenase [Paracoccus subflavus]TBN42000.1 NAD(P)-dependent alcohol dehydrogenase [Paracoccus subflavus]
MSTIRAWAATTAGGRLEPFEYDPGPLGPEDVEVEIDHCGICHSDLSMLDNEWGISAYPFVPGHEAIGRVAALGELAAQRGLQVGQRVGIGWNVRSCLYCKQCLRGQHHLCERVQPTIIGHHGAFAERVRAHWLWTIPIPEGLDPSATGPLLCGGITVFAPLADLEVPPTARIGVFGIGGLGHMALMFGQAWGCEVTAFTSSPDKGDEARSFGASNVVSSRDSDAMARLAGQFDYVFVTANAPLDWDAIIAMLAPQGRLHFLGAVLEPVPVHVMNLLLGAKAVSASPTGSRAVIDAMLGFAARHEVKPKVEHFPMSRVNEAMDHLRAGKASYRIVLDADFD